MMSTALVVLVPRANDPDADREVQKQQPVAVIVPVAACDRALLGTQVQRHHAPRQHRDAETVPLIVMTPSPSVSPNPDVKLTLPASASTLAVAFIDDVVACVEDHVAAGRRSR